jgi:hypothetical protein
MLSVTILASFVVNRVRKDIRFRFFVLLCFIIIITDLGGAFLAIGLYLELTPFDVKRTKELAIEIGVTVFLNLAGSNLIQWLFSFKYWVIS